MDLPASSQDLTPVASQVDDATRSDSQRDGVFGGNKLATEVPHIQHSVIAAIDRDVATLNQRVTAC